MKIFELFDRSYPVKISRVSNRDENGSTLRFTRASFTTDAGGEYYALFGKTGLSEREKEIVKKSGPFAKLGAMSKPGGVWELHFFAVKEGVDHHDRQDAQGEEFRIFATVVDFAKKQIAKATPETLLIKSDNADSKRSRLYDRMINRFANDIGFTIKNTTVDSNGRRVVELEMK